MSTRAVVASTYVDALKEAGVTSVTGVPDSGFADMISQLDADHFGDLYVPATREDNAMAIAVGAWLAGETPLVFMESSGFGNVLDVVTSLVNAYEVPLVIFIAWAGFHGMDVPHHNAIGKPLPAILDALGIAQVEVVLGDVDGFRIGLTRAVEQARRRKAPVALMGIPANLKEKADAA